MNTTSSPDLVFSYNTGPGNEFQAPHVAAVVLCHYKSVEGYHHRNQQQQQQQMRFVGASVTSASFSVSLDWTEESSLVRCYWCIDHVVDVHAIARTAVTTLMMMMRLITIYAASRYCGFLSISHNVYVCACVRAALHPFRTDHRGSRCIDVVCHAIDLSSLYASDAPSNCLFGISRTLHLLTHKHSVSFTSRVLPSCAWSLTVHAFNRLKQFRAFIYKQNCSIWPHSL